MGGYLSDPLVFVVQAVSGLYIGALLLRVHLAWVRADFYNPVSQFLVAITRPLLHPLRRVIPAVGRVDSAAVVLMLALQALALLLMGVLRGAVPGLPPLLVLSAAGVLDTWFSLLLFLLLAAVLMSWLNPGPHPVARLLHQAAEPLLAPARKWLPPIAGVDVSPVLVFILLQVAQMLLIPPLHQLARALA